MKMKDLFSLITSEPYPFVKIRADCGTATFALAKDKRYIHVCNFGCFACKANLDDFESVVSNVVKPPSMNDFDAKIVGGFYD